jgi:hypothetical protein
VVRLGRCAREAEAAHWRRWRSARASNAGETGFLRSPRWNAGSWLERWRAAPTTRLDCCSIPRRG